MSEAKQTAKLIARIVENLPALPAASMQRLIESPTRLQQLLRLLLCFSGQLPFLLPVADWDEERYDVESLTRGGERLIRHKTESGQGTIFAYETDFSAIQVGQLVFANGRYGPPTGTPGIVVEINKPFTGGLTDNVIQVHFFGRAFPDRMKFSDLEPLGIERKPSPAVL